MLEVISSFNRVNIPQAFTTEIQNIQQNNIMTQYFFKQIQQWNNIQISYINKLNDIQNNLTPKKNNHINSIILNRIQLLLNTLIKSHKEISNKINYDIIMVNSQATIGIINTQKKLIDQLKVLNREISTKKDQLEKAIQRKEKQRKNKQEQQIIHIFMNDSVDMTMQKKIRQFSKIRQLQKQITEHQLKISDISQGLLKSLQRQNIIHQQIQKNNNQSLHSCHQTIMKLELHYYSQTKITSQQIQKLIKQTKQINFPINENITMENIDLNQKNIQNFKITNHISTNYRNSEIQLIFNQNHNNHIKYIQNSLNLINNKQLDSIIQYTREQQTKVMIRQMLLSDNVNPVIPIEILNEIKIIKKLMKNCQDQQMVIEFRNILHKDYKMRLNFVFMLQAYRLNGRFQIAKQDSKGMYCLLYNFIDICHQSKDSYSLKHLIILLLTYYVYVPQGNSQRHKVYLITFFKNLQSWNDIQFWQSMLIQCIYIEKKNSVKSTILSIGTQITYLGSDQKKQLLFAEKSTVQSQLIYIAKNMALFNFKEKCIKAFTQRFVRLLKLDQRCLKQIYAIIEEAEKQQDQNKQIQQIVQTYAQVNLSHLTNGYEELSLLDKKKVIKSCIM